MQGKLIAVAYTLCTYWNQFSLGGICKQEYFDNYYNSHNSFLWQEYFIDFSFERWIPCQGSTSVLCLHYRPVTVHCSLKDAYTSEITFHALNPIIYLRSAESDKRELIFGFFDFLAFFFSPFFFSENSMGGSELNKYHIYWKR